MIPVVIAANGRGIPVRAVEGNAPVMQVAGNGRGIPIVLSDLGAPFVVRGLDPVLPTLTITDGTITTFTRGGVDYTQVLWRQGGGFTLSGDVGAQWALVGGGASGGQQNLAPGGGGAGATLQGSDLDAGTYDISIGAGGVGVTTTGNQPGSNGSPSSILRNSAAWITAPGGGAGGGGGGGDGVEGRPGGNGGGGAGSVGSTGFGGVGDPGNDGGDAFNSGTSNDRSGGGGGGAGFDGQDGALGVAGNGGPGITLSWTEPPMDICGGGGGSSSAPSNGAATHGGTPGVRDEPSADAENGGGSGGSTAGTGKGGDGLFVLVVRSDEVIVEEPPQDTGPLFAHVSTMPNGIVLAGHSSLAPSGGPALADVGPWVSDFGQSSADVWGNNGPARTRPAYDLLIASESDAEPGDLYAGIAHPASEIGLGNLQHLYWLGLEAKDRGATFALFQNPSAVSNPVDETNRAHMNYYREWLERHLDMPVWLIPGDRYVQELRDRGMTDSQIMPDGVHLNGGNGVAQGAEWQAVAFITGQLPAGASGDIADAALASIETHFWAGMGGTEYGASLDIADPLPAPLPRPGEPEPEPVDGLLWTADGYDGPTLTGTQPTIADGVMSFDGTGLTTTSFTTEGFYAVMAIRTGAVGSQQALLYLNPEPGNIFADPYGDIHLGVSGMFGADRWPENIAASFIAHTPGEWQVIEGWVIGTSVGGYNGTTDTTSAAGSAQPETSGLNLFGIGQSLDATYLRIERTMPDGARREALRAEAQATIPEG